MNRSLLRAAACLAVLAVSPLVRAGQSQQIRTDDDSGISITVSRVFDNTPPGGSAPVRITITNNSDRQGTWEFSASRYIRSGNLTSTTTMTVGPGETRTAPFVVFLGQTQRGNNINIRTSGPGVRSFGSASLQHNYNSGSDQTPFLAMSRELAAHSWEPLKKNVEKAKWAFDATQFDPADLPDDWRAYAGVRYLALSDAEWVKLSAGVRTALRQWAGTGGNLLIASTSPASIDWGGEGPAYPKTAEMPYGFGSLGAMQWDGKELKTGDLAEVLRKKRAEQDNPPGETTGWEMLRSLGTLKPNAPLILGFVIVFAALVGPINLFVFAPPVHRHRMFWTTPVLAVGGSLLLMAVITFQEGTGGIGRRFTVISLIPSAHEAVTVQDQVSRTGLLYGTAFRLPEDTLPSPLPLSLASQREQNGSCNVAGRSFSGDWFRSRSLQAQRFTAIRPTRAEVTVVSRDASTGAPTIVSSIESPLETLLFTDEGNKFWRADNVRTGEKTVLRPMVWNDRENTIRQMLTSARDTTRESVLRLKGSGFTALVTRPKSEIVPTLPSIRWWDDRVIYTGPVTDRTHVSGPAGDSPASQQSLQP